jgi:rhodanese-related sulfurtransferase
MFGHLKTLFGLGGRAISPHEAVQRINAGACVIDVREPDEFIQGSIPNAINVPLSDIEREGMAALRQAGIVHEQGDLLIVCRSGARSGGACTRLQGALGERALNLRGGLMAWAGAGLPMRRMRS